jgi:hypothetical protein
LKLALSSVVPAPRARVFAALVDPVILQRSIPGCESLIEVAPDVYEAKLNIGLAGLKGSYTGKATIRDRQPPDSLTLGVAGNGGPGFVRGVAALTLTDTDAGATHVQCDADVQVGGLIAAIGSRLIEAAAKKMAADFFGQLSQQVAA